MKSIYTDDYINIISVLRATRINKNITQAEMARLSRLFLKLKIESVD